MTDDGWISGSSSLEYYTAQNMAEFIAYILPQLKEPDRGTAILLLERACHTYKFTLRGVMATGRYEVRDRYPRGKR
jgi:hypothetical protein